VPIHPELPHLSLRNPHLLRTPPRVDHHLTADLRPQLPQRSPLLRSVPSTLTDRQVNKEEETMAVASMSPPPAHLRALTPTRARGDSLGPSCCLTSLLRRRRRLSSLRRHRQRYPLPRIIEVTFGILSGGWSRAQRSRYSLPFWDIGLRWAAPLRYTILLRVLSKQPLPLHLPLSWRLNGRGIWRSFVGGRSGATWTPCCPSLLPSRHSRCSTGGCARS
jgi:hypothetical protein